MTRQEVKLWVHLREWRKLGYHFRRQWPHGGYIMDFVCLKHHLVVEVDGSGHARHYQTVHDARRDDLLRSDRFRVLRFWNNEIDNNLTGVLDAIMDAVGGNRTPPTALRAVPPPRFGEG